MILSNQAFESKAWSLSHLVSLFSLHRDVFVRNDDTICKVIGRAAKLLGHSSQTVKSKWLPTRYDVI